MVNGFYCLIENGFTEEKFVGGVDVDQQGTGKGRNFQVPTIAMDVEKGKPVKLLD